MEKKTIIRIPALPFALMYGAISAVIGLIIGIFSAIFWNSIFSFMSSMPTYTPPSWTGFGLLFGTTAVVFFPIMMFAFGLLQGLIFAVLYNFLAPRIGGIKLYFEAEPHPVTTQ